MDSRNVASYLSRLGWCVEYKTDVQGSIQGFQKVRIIIEGNPPTHLMLTY